MSDDFIYNLIKLLKMFNNRPYHLAKFLIDNSALSKEFSKNILNNKKLDSISENDIDKLKFFNSISEMEDFYTSLVMEVDEKGVKDIIEINKKLDFLINSERFEDAAKVRDYMKRNNIKRI